MSTVGFPLESDRALTQTDRDYVFLQSADTIIPGLAGALCRLGAAHLTVCPRCHVDDFVHVENCILARPR